MSLSVAIATHNEENNINRTLESVYDWVDEVVVVDGASTDKTVERIKKYDVRNIVKLYNEDNPPMFHINKQKAIERCTGDWILQLDADEVVSDDLKREIIEIVNPKSDPPAGELNSKQIPNSKSQNTTYEIRDTKYIAYWLPRLNYFLGRPLKKGGQYPDYTLRLYKNGVAKFPCRDVHEQVTIRRIVIPSEVEGSTPKDTSLDSSPDLSRDQNDIDKTIGYLKSDLHHYPYKTFTDYLTKWIRYCQLEAQLLHSKKVTPSLKNWFLYILVFPDFWFVKTYIRNRGYVDGFPGFVFSLFSALRYRVTYCMLYELHHKHKTDS